MRFLTTSLVPFGRAPRRQLWLFFLINVAISAGWTALQDGFDADRQRSLDILDHLGRNYLLYSCLYLSVVYATAMTLVNRYHDRGMTGWNLMWLAIPIVVAIAAYTISSYNVISQLGFAPEFAQKLSKWLWALFWPLAILITLAIYLRSLTQPGDPGPNRYGPPPGH